MSIDTQISRALEQAATGAQSRAGAWVDIEQRIGRSRRHRRAWVAVATVVGLAAAAVSYSIVDRPPQPTATSEPNTIAPRSGGFRLPVPLDWIGRADDDLSVTITPPGQAKSPSGEMEFTISGNLASFKYDETGMDPFFMFDGRGTGGQSSRRTEVEVAGRSGVRWDIAPYDSSSEPPTPSPETADRILYLIDWPGSAPQCESAHPCTLTVDIKASSPLVMQRYFATAQQIAFGVEIIPAEALPAVRGVQAKIPLKAGALATGGGAVWALSAIDNDYHLDHLYRVDPKTNSITGSVDVGYLPTALAADAEGVWIANRRACDEIADCADSEHPGSTDLPGPPAQSCVTRIDPQTLKVVSIVELRSPQAVALGAGAVWVVDKPATGKASLVRIDPSNNSIVATIPLVGGFDTPTVSVLNGVVWVTSGQKLHRIDPASNSLTATYDIAGSLITPAPTGEELWLSGFVGTTAALLRVDPEAGRVIGTYAKNGFRRTGGGHSIWSIGGSGSFGEFDTDRRAANSPTYFRGDPGANGLTSGFGSIWVALGDGTLWRIAQ
jgi:hypothetical protein